MNSTLTTDPQPTMTPNSDPDPDPAATATIRYRPGLIFLAVLGSLAALLFVTFLLCSFWSCRQRRKAQGLQRVRDNAVAELFGGVRRVELVRAWEKGVNGMKEVKEGGFEDVDLKAEEGTEGEKEGEEGKRCTRWSFTEWIR